MSNHLEHALMTYYVPLRTQVLKRGSGIHRKHKPSLELARDEVTGRAEVRVERVRVRFTGFRVWFTQTKFTVMCPP